MTENRVFFLDLHVIALVFLVLRAAINHTMPA
jgi:hypothetical protein